MKDMFDMLYLLEIFFFGHRIAFFINKRETDV